jgi:hypothetical protein
MRFQGTQIVSTMPVFKGNLSEYENELTLAFEAAHLLKENVLFKFIENAGPHEFKKFGEYYYSCLDHISKFIKLDNIVGNILGILYSSFSGIQSYSPG